MAAAFEQIQVERWDAPLVRLPDRDAVRDYLIARFVPPEVATDAAGRITTPATITKRGALIQARKAEGRPYRRGCCSKNRQSRSLAETGASGAAIGSSAAAPGQAWPMSASS